MCAKFWPKLRRFFAFLCFFFFFADFFSDDQVAVGDAFKLYWHFYNSDSSGLPGVFLTLFLYIVLMTTGKIPMFARCSF